MLEIPIDNLRQMKEMLAQQERHLKFLQWHRQTWPKEREKILEEINLLFAKIDRENERFDQCPTGIVQTQAKIKELEEAISNHIPASQKDKAEGPSKKEKELATKMLELMRAHLSPQEIVQYKQLHGIK